MAFQSVPETASVYVSMTYQGLEMGNTFYFKKTGGYSQSDLVSLAADMDAWVGTEYLPFLSNEIMYNRVIVRGLEDENDYVVENDDSQGLGSLSASRLPASLAFCFKRLSGFTGRSARGRVYVPAVSQDAVSGTNENTMYASRIAELLAALLEIATYAATHGWIEVIVSRFQNHLKRPVAQTLNVVDWSFTDATFDTQRNRLH